MYVTSRLLRWVCGGVLICAGLSPSVGFGAFITTTIQIGNASSNAVTASSYRTDGVLFYDHGTVAAGSSGTARYPGVLQTVGEYFRVYIAASGVAGPANYIYTTDVTIPASGALPIVWWYTGGGVPTTTNTCTASLTLFHTESFGFAQKWDVYWVDSAHGSHLMWSGFIEKGATLPLTVTWDEGTGHCPGQLQAIGERPGYDSPTNLVSNSTSGVRDLEDPAAGGDPEFGDGDDPDGTSTNSLTKGDLSELMAELRGIAKERTQQGSTNILGGIYGGIVTGNTKLTLVNGQLGTVTNQLNTIIGQLSAATNSLKQAVDLAGLQLTNQIGISNSLRAPLSIADFTNRAGMNTNMAAAQAYESALEVNPWSGSFSNSASVGPWAGKLAGLEMAGGPGGILTNIPTSMVGAEPAPEEDWFEWEQPSFQLLGATVGAGWEWKMTPGLPSTDTGSFSAILAFIRLVWSVGISFYLFWRIRNDVQERLMQLASIPQAQSSGLKVAGWDLGPVGRLMAAAAMVAILYTFGAHVLGWIAGASASWGDYSWSQVSEAAETGSVGGFVTKWLPRVLLWVGQAFPFALAFGALSMEITYQMTRDAALRLACVALKRAGGILVLTLSLSLSSSASAASFVDGGDGGCVEVSGSATNLSVRWGLADVTLGPGTWHVPAWGLECVSGNGASNYVGHLGLADGSGVLVAADGSCLVYRSDAKLREESMLNWGTSGVAAGVFFGLLSLIGWIWKRGLFPAGANWGGDS